MNPHPHHRTRIKCCGITRRADALAAAALGADAVGFVFTRRSPRFVEPGAAAAIRAALPPFVAAVALFMDDAPEWVAEVERRLRPDLLQFHGGESAGFCERFATRYLKAVPMAGLDDIGAVLEAHPHAAGFLLDGHAAGEPGGSGRRFDWGRVPHGSGRALLLAGGLDAGNVGEAVRTAHPWGVDVSSGIESAPGVKDVQRMAAFVQAVRVAEAGRDPGGAGACPG